MKKTFYAVFLLAIAVTLSACTTKKTEQSQPTAPLANESANLVPEAVPAADLPQTPVLSENILINEATNTVNSNTTMSENLREQYSQAIIKTNYGDISVKFYGEDSPNTVENFLKLAKSGFYDGTKFHRVIKDFMIQGGDPLSKGTDTSLYGTGGPGYQFADEFNSRKLVAGSLAMANSGPNTNGSQFFIVTAAETPWLDGRHTNFGEVVSGLEVVKKIEAVATGANDRPLEDVVVNSVELIK